MQQNDPSFDTIWDELTWRGHVQVSTDPEALEALLADGTVAFYAGFDPTAPSLHLGHLVQLIVMRRLQLAGHRPLALVGGSTGLIGDPRPTSERTLNEKGLVGEWVDFLQRQISRYLDFEGPRAARLVNNLDWTAGLSAIDFLRDIGKHYRVGTMLKKDVVSARLNSAEGISYTEFSYQILQGLDFLQLYRDQGCLLQLGGSDQWGNLTSGIDLIHRVEGVRVHAFGTPLLTKADGTKYSKSEGTALWIDAALTSAYAFYQFWLNVDDAEVVSLLKTFTFLPREEIERLAGLVESEPHRREAQRVLAADVTSLVHGSDATEAAIAASHALFGRGALADIDSVTLRAALDELPGAEADKSTTVAQALVDIGLTRSLGEARRAIGQGGVYLNNERVADESLQVGNGALADGLAVLRRGKKTLGAVFLR